VIASRFIHRLEDLDGSQVASAGGKGASLGELRRAGVRVPPAFIVNRSAFDAFMATADPHGRVAGWLTDVDSDRLGCAEAAAAIQELLGNAPVPDEIVSALRESLSELGAERVSVRSSATGEDGTAPRSTTGTWSRSTPPAR
jgi:pyruvate,water dikinase